MAWRANNGALGMVILCFWKQKSRDYPVREYATGEIPEVEVPRLAVIPASEDIVQPGYFE